jgi:endogenous inhibitor of DNA gyrase (YacG/DUF329 family)
MVNANKNPTMEYGRKKIDKCQNCGKEVPRDGDSKKTPVICSSGHVYCSLICYHEWKGKNARKTLGT